MNDDQRRALENGCISCGILPDVEAMEEIPIPARHAAGLSTKPWFCCRCIRDIRLHFLRCEEDEKQYKLADYRRRMLDPSA